MEFADTARIVLLRIMASLTFSQKIYAIMPIRTRKSNNIRNVEYLDINLEIKDNNYVYSDV